MTLLWEIWLERGTPFDPDPTWSLAKAVLARGQAMKQACPTSRLKVPDVIVSMGDAEEFKGEQETKLSHDAVRQKPSVGCLKQGRIGAFSSFGCREGLLYYLFHLPEIQSDKWFCQLVVPVVRLVRIMVLIT